MLLSYRLNVYNNMYKLNYLTFRGVEQPGSSLGS